MWDPNKNEKCPCPSAATDIPVIRIKVPELEEDLEKLKKVGREYTEPSVPIPEKEQEQSKSFVGPYVPTPYIFRLEGGPPVAGQHVRSPPLWLLMDHTLAVIWSTFSPKKEQALGVGQLEWALAFLLKLKDANGQYAPDVQICIDAIENCLIGQYTCVKDSAMLEKQIPCGLHICEPCHGGKQEKDAGKGKEPLMTIKEEASGAGITLAVQTPFVCPNIEKTSEKPVPVSVTIHSMLKSHSTSVHQLFRAGSSTINKPSEEAFTLAKAPGAQPELPLGASKDEVLDFLKQWREDQISRINGEMTRLRSIEALMANVDNSSAPTENKDNKPATSPSN